MCKANLINKIWMKVVVERKYLGISIMKKIARSIMKDDLLFKASNDHGEYKKFRYSEWLRWVQDEQSFELYNDSSGRIILSIYQFSDDHDKCIDRGLEVYDLNLHLVYDRNNIDETCDFYEKIYKQEFLANLKKYSILKNNINSHH